MKRISVFWLGVCILLSACVPAAPAATSTPTQTLTPLPSKTPTLEPTATLTFTPSPSPTATTTRVPQGPGIVNIPILLYHHVQNTDYFSRYRVPPAKFEQQMKLLHDWEYTTITTDMLVQAITKGAALPPRPILITFDDGDVDVYENAFPILQKYGFTGVFYLVANYVGQPDYISVKQIKEMTAAGWEIGSHSLNHIDLVLNPKRQRAEVVESKQQLEKLLGVPVKTFAYPFGRASSGVINYVHFAKYTAGMGLGYTGEQGKGNLFFLQRWEVQSGFSMKSFAAFLPWKGAESLIPSELPTPTPNPAGTLPPSETAP